MSNKRKLIIRQTLNGTRSTQTAGTFNINSVHEHTSNKPALDFHLFTYMCFGVHSYADTCIYISVSWSVCLLYSHRLIRQSVYSDMFLLFFFFPVPCDVVNRISWILLYSFIDHNWKILFRIMPLNNTVFLSVSNITLRFVKYKIVYRVFQ